MKLRVNENCIGCGMCASIAEAIFELTDEGVAHCKVDEISADDEAAATEAKDSCPVGAIEEN